VAHGTGGSPVTTGVHWAPGRLRTSSAPEVRGVCSCPEGGHRNDAAVEVVTGIRATPGWSGLTERAGRSTTTRWTSVRQGRLEACGSASRSQRARATQSRTDARSPRPNPRASTSTRSRGSRERPDARAPSGHGRPAPLRVPPAAEPQPPPPSSPILGRRRGRNHEVGVNRGVTPTPLILVGREHSRDAAAIRLGACLRFVANAIARARGGTRIKRSCGHILNRMLEIERCKRP
jgi:hypothetical protein